MAQPETRTRARRFIALLVVMLFVFVASSCGDDGDPVVSDDSATTTTVARQDDEPSCSAASLSADPEERPQLPDPVAVMRQQIINAATACNYEQLAELALEGESQFTHSFGDEGDPAEYWRQLEAEGEEPLRFLVELLNLPNGVKEENDPDVYVWPSAFAYDKWSDVPEEDREALTPLYDEEELEQFEQFGSYIGYRVGITASGDWIFFVAGD